MKAEN